MKSTRFQATPNVVLLTFGITSVLIACTPRAGPSEQDEPSTQVRLLDPPAPSEGVQYRMTATIDPGQESYGCKLFKAPPEGLYINREKVSFSVGGHHVLLYKTPYTEIPTENEQGEPIDAASVHDCSRGVTASWRVSGVVGGSESFGGKGLLEELPEGVAVAIEPGAVLAMSTHYLNATPSPIEVDSRINLYTIPAGAVSIEAGVLYFDNPIIHVPAHGASTARMSCPVSRDIAITGLQSHMHSRGKGFAAHLLGAGGVGATAIYSTDSWKEPPVVELIPSLAVAAGQAIEYRCDYQSSEAHDVVQGATDGDEMCQLIGPYYPRDPRLEACEDEEGVIAATWIGDGSATCAETLTCLEGAGSVGKDGGAEAWACVQASCPGAAEAVSGVVRCRISQGRGTCSAACGGSGNKATNACEECLMEACEAAADACASAECG